MDMYDVFILLFAFGVIFLATLQFISITDIESLEHRYDDMLNTLDEITKVIDGNFQIVNGNFRRVCERVDEIDEAVSQQRREIDLLNGVRTTEMPSNDGNMERVSQELFEKGLEVTEAKERFHKLSKELSLEDFKEEADEYFDGKLQETYDTIDNAWGDELMIACEMQRRYKAKWEKVKNALTTEEAYEAMFSPC